MANCKVMIFTEDTYGRDFIKELVNRMKRLGVIDKSVKVKTTKLAGVCNTKSERQIKASSTSFDRILIIVDADGGAIDDVKSRVESHIPNFLKSKTRTIIIKYEIEEWILESHGVKVKGKPSEQLNQYIKKLRGDASARYKKSMLPTFANDIKFEKVMHNESFRQLLEGLNC